MANIEDFSVTIACDLKIWASHILWYKLFSGQTVWYDCGNDWTMKMPGRNIFSKNWWWSKFYVALLYDIVVGCTCCTSEWRWAIVALCVCLNGHSTMKTAANVKQLHLYCICLWQRNTMQWTLLCTVHTFHINIFIHYYYSIWGYSLLELFDANINSINILFIKYTVHLFTYIGSNLILTCYFINRDLWKIIK